MKQVIFNFIILRTTPQYIELYTMVLKQLQTSVRIITSPYVRYQIIKVLVPENYLQIPWYVFEFGY